MPGPQFEVLERGCAQAEVMKRLSNGRVETMEMKRSILLVPGIVIKGHRVASGPSKEYPYGSLEPQKSFFKAQGLNLDRFFPCTLNISITA